ncbi:NADPH:quinone reductase [Mycolicibacterium agri]|uniref:NAD(P)H dehydrogenase n=1 Tax=Mycolicibacterium agri TaxID=36811 RepID=A0A2A7MMH3_MYCAG|nr:NAD(P)H-dependent oxidoreductase [Mycolicibacterium agri]PEG33002.1 NADPH:quinone reductase [Mycolicibacterium agri]GFG48575.1 NAD(P)H dehydrogenase [Mycolicibacterium agri]
MKVLWVFAHPEQSSLNGSLMKEGLQILTELGHDYQVSDLYAMKWKAQVDRDDCSQDIEGRFSVSRESQRAFLSGTLSLDVVAEQRKLEWADVVVLQFPLWWYSVPAILKGWIDRVFVKGFAYGIRDPQNPSRTLRYGDGPLAGKKALTILTSGSPPAALGPRGINGRLDEVLFPLLHGTLWYVGIAPLPPMCVNGADRLSDTEFDDATAELHDRLENLEEDQPIPFRRQNGGDYDDDLVLRPELAPGRAGIAVHYEDR